MDSIDGDDLAVINRFLQFRGDGISIGELESRICGMTAQEARDEVRPLGVGPDLLVGARTVKALSAQIDTYLHAVGILQSLQLSKVLGAGERVESLSLGAGTSASEFDLVTDRQVAEFKFYRWTADNAGRTKGLFSDVVKLALWEGTPNKERILYLTGTERAEKFLSGRASIKSTLSRNSNLYERFCAAYNTKHYEKVGDYWADLKGLVRIVNLEGEAGFEAL